jgi:hypothetical protein
MLLIAEEQNAGSWFGRGARYLERQAQAQHECQQTLAELDLQLEELELARKRVRKCCWRSWNLSLLAVGPEELGAGEEKGEEMIFLTSKGLDLQLEELGADEETGKGLGKEIGFTLGKNFEKKLNKIWICEKTQKFSTKL